MQVDWTDFHHFLEVARTGTVSAASERLGVDHTTVARRMSRLEAALGVTLFDRRRAGYALTDTGQALLTHAEAMESAVAAAGESVGGARGSAAGTVRLGTPEAFGVRILTPRLGTLIDQHPDLSVELLLLHRFASLASREADLIVTLEPPTSGRYVVTRLTPFRYLLYGSPAYLARHRPIGSPADLASHAFIDYVQDQLMSDELRYLDRLMETPRRVFSSTSMLAQAQAAEAGLGLAMMAPYVVGPHSPLVQVLPGAVAVDSVLWLAAPADLFRLRRVRVVWDFLRSLVDESPAPFLGPPEG